MVEWKPTATIDVLRKRSRIIQLVRTWFFDHGYWEVETPILSQETVIDAHLDPMTLDDNRLRRKYLQTSPEAAMKRLLSAGADRIFQICHTFRDGETSKLHNPEFTMLEWYAIGETYFDQMACVQELVVSIIKEYRPELLETRFDRWTYEEAFKLPIGVSILECSIDELRAIAKKNSIATPPGMETADIDEWRNLLLIELVEPVIQQKPALFLYDYPASQAALAKVGDDVSPVAERFELYLNGVEVCNGYHELTDADELRRRCTEQNDIRVRTGMQELPIPERLLAAMDAGLPNCSGVALGIDRLVMFALGIDEISSVIPFPHHRA